VAKHTQQKLGQSKKRQLFVPIFVGIVAFIAGVGLTLVAGLAMIGHVGFSQNQSRGSLSKITGVYQTIKANYYKPVDSNKLINGAINGMVASLNDPFSEYLANQDATDLNNTISGSFGGIGTSVKQAGNYVAVDAPVKNTPATKAGLKTDDLIVSIDGKSAKNLTVAKVVAKIRGKIGTKVTLGLRRGSTAFTLTLTRAKIPVKTVTGAIDQANPTVGNIQITTFSEPTGKELKQTIKSLRQKGAKRFVIDLRGNPGGTLPTALETASMFLKNGQTIMQTQEKGAQPVKYVASKDYDQGFKVKEKTVVLVDGDSASAAEIFASALQQSANAQVIGTQSYGKGTVQTVSDLGGNSEMKITTAKWLQPNGTWINHKGVTPNQLVKYPDYAYLSTFDTGKTYQLNQSSRSIVAIQKILNALGYPVDQENGVYDQSMQTAVTNFQNDQLKNGVTGLQANGVVDPATGDALVNALTQKISQNDPMYAKAVAVLTQ
jgi:carboxyl-terminal processing protease